MTTASLAAIAAYSITSFCAFLMVRRGSNRRLRFLCFVVGLLPMCQLLTLLQSNGILISAALGRATETVELMIGAMCLAGIHYLNQEIRDRNKVDAKLRLAESAFPQATSPRRRMRRFVVPIPATSAQPVGQ